ncbi:MAG: hypothetical protein ACD_20C00328G0014 [uncultured bacterium]|nr:MAG: hypothetical protein ACD_20C00328G0014 [uncultured bacterium]HBH18026.1 hypothetical protein [Cyanobacteria bacterium UBA9579]
MKKAIFFSSLVLIVYFLTFRIPVPDFDLWARLAVGSLFFQTGGVLPHDIFAYSITKPTWVDHEWGTGVLFYSLTRCFGDLGIFVLKGILIFAIFILIYKVIRLNQDKFNNAFYFLLIGFTLYPSIASTVRSQIFTFFFFALWIYLLERVRRGENRLLWILPITMIIWANMHGGFLAGLGLLFIYAVGELLNRKNPLKYFGILALSSMATLINPYGIKYWHYILEATTLNRIGFIEWQPISLTGPFHNILGMQIHVLSGFFIFILLTVIVAFIAFIKRYNTDWVKILLALITLYMALKHQRHVVFFVLAMSGLMYSHFAYMFNWLVEQIKDRLGDKSLIIPSFSFKIGVLALIIYLSSLIYPIPTKFIVSPAVYPVGSLEFIKQNNLSGNLAITYNWGSYALWKLYPQCRVLIDGRYEEVYPNDMYLLALKFSEHIGNDWAKFLNVFHTDIIVAPKSAYKPVDLLSLENWKPVYEDQVSVVLVPKDKVQDFTFHPNVNNQAYWQENFAKPVDLN